MQIVNVQVQYMDLHFLHNILAIFGKKTLFKSI